MWDLPGLGIEPVSPALAGVFSTTGPQGKSHGVSLIGGCDNRELHAPEQCKLSKHSVCVKCLGFAQSPGLCQLCQGMGFESKVKHDYRPGLP